MSNPRYCIPQQREGNRDRREVWREKGCVEYHSELMSAAAADAPPPAQRVYALL